MMYSVHYFAFTCSGGGSKRGSNPVIYVQCTLLYMYVYRRRMYSTLLKMYLYMLMKIGGSNPVIYVQCTLLYMYMYRWRG